MANDGLLTPAEVAEIFRVELRTVMMWARQRTTQAGAVKTPTGRWRFREDRIKQLARGEHDNDG
jgi:predicted site-specific integrase-resolvase